MTSWGVERTPRTAYPVSTPPGDVSSPMPPHSQGAERRPERRAGRTGSRWALRALVIGGLAGTAWLLTGAAAQAADREAATGDVLGSSLIGSVVHGDTAPPVVGKVLKAAAQPLESDRPKRHHVTSSVLDAPVRAIARPVAAITETLDEVSGPLRLDGGPDDSRQPAPDAPITHDLGLTSTDADVVDADDAGTEDTEPVRTAPDPVTAEVPEAPVAATAATRTADITAAHPVGSHGFAGKRHSTVTERTAVTASAPDTVQDSTPAGDGPAPLQVHLGALSGISTSGSGAPTEGGSAAFLPAAVGGGPVANHRSAFPADVEVRRHDAEAPTVSPD